MLQLRPYQAEAVDALVKELGEWNAVLGVLPTGAGKTPVAGALVAALQTSRPNPKGQGGTLFLADAEILVAQAARTLHKWSGILPSIEMASERAATNYPLVVGTTQSMAKRLQKYNPDYFSYIIVDEAHRNTAGAQMQAIWKYFPAAKKVGFTATPFRGHKKDLGQWYQKIAYEIDLLFMIRNGFLAPIKIKQVKTNIDISKVRTSKGEYNVNDLEAAIDPHIAALAQVIRDHAPTRRTVAFLPTIAVSKAFAQACRNLGLKAIHVDGDNKSVVSLFSSGNYNIVCCSQLLSTGWDEPSVDCVANFSPTRSFAAYAQKIGRGTRLHPGKEHLLVLDPLYLADEINLIRPASLVAKTEDISQGMDSIFAGARDDLDPVDLLDCLRKTEKLVEHARHKALEERLKEVAKRKAKMIDALELCMYLHEEEAADYQPIDGWEQERPSDRQLATLEKAGIDTASITCRGHASKILDLVNRRRDAGLATPKQLKHLRRILGEDYPGLYLIDFKQAGILMTEAWRGRGYSVARVIADKFFPAYPL